MVHGPAGSGSLHRNVWGRSVPATSPLFSSLTNSLTVLHMNDSDQILTLILFGFAAPIGLFLGLLYSQAISNLRVALVELTRILFTFAFLIVIPMQYWSVDTVPELILEIVILLGGFVVLEIIRRRILRAPAKQ